MYTSNYPNRTLCDVLREMRSTYETRNFSSLLGLIEEAQSMGNRMEAALSDKRDIRHYTEERSKLIKEVRALEEQKKALGGKDDA
jgi:hypothetical protein